MAPWLADRVWLQVLLVSLYVLGFVMSGTWAARQPRSDGGYLAVVGCALFGGFFVPLLAVPAALVWGIGRLLSMGGGAE